MSQCPFKGKQTFREPSLNGATDCESLGRFPYLSTGKRLFRQPVSRCKAGCKAKPMTGGLGSIRESVSPFCLEHPSESTRCSLRLDRVSPVCFPGWGIACLKTHMIGLAYPHAEVDTHTRKIYQTQNTSKGDRSSVISKPTERKDID